YEYLEDIFNPSMFPSVIDQMPLVFYRSYLSREQHVLSDNPSAQYVDVLSELIWSSPAKGRSFVPLVPAKINDNTPYNLEFALKLNEAIFHVPMKVLVGPMTSTEIENFLNNYNPFPNVATVSYDAYRRFFNQVQQTQESFLTELNALILPNSTPISLISDVAIDLIKTFPLPSLMVGEIELQFGLIYMGRDKDQPITIKLTVQPKQEADLLAEIVSPFPQSITVGAAAYSHYQTDAASVTSANFLPLFNQL
ncbi:unnamed protein product, partial [Didymodactylos carnosus]